MGGKFFSNAMEISGLSYTEAAYAAEETPP